MVKEIKVTQPKNFPSVVKAIIEIPKGSKNKYEIDKESGLLKLDRPLFSAMHYPGDYGYIPHTLWEDGDPIDIIVMTNHPVYPLTLTEVRIIGMIDMKDDNESDVKLLGVYNSDPRYAEYHDVKDIKPHQQKEILNFFEYYKQLQKKKVKVNKSIKNKDAALKAILKSQKAYNFS